MAISIRTHTRAGAALGALAVSLSLVVSTATPAQAVGATKASRTYGATAEKATNAQRVKHGRVKLKPNACLATYAAKHAKKLAKAGGGINHQSLEPILRACKLSMVGENVAVGYGSGKKVVTQGWMKSPGHRRNILEKRFNRGEVVARTSAQGRWYAVQLFGRR